MRRFAVLERVHRDDVQMRHRGADDEVRVEIARAQPARDLAHQRPDLLGRRTDVTIIRIIGSSHVRMPAGGAGGSR
jgi:hypothetical protein